MSDLSDAEWGRLADAIGAELYESLMEASADQWRQWYFLTDHAKEQYRAEGARIVAEAVAPVVDRLLADRLAAAEARAARLAEVVARGAALANTGTRQAEAGRHDLTAKRLTALDKILRAALASPASVPVGSVAGSVSAEEPSGGSPGAAGPGEGLS